MVVGYFRDDQPGMLTSDYRPDIDWESDGLVDDVGQVWYAGGGWWAVTATHTYATPGEFYITLTVNDTLPGGMSTTTYSYVNVRPGTAPGGGNAGLSPDVVAALQPARVQPVASQNPPSFRAAAPFPPPTPEAGVVAALVAGQRDENVTASTGRELPAWLDDELVDALTVNLLMT